MRNKNLFSIIPKQKFDKFFLLGRVNYAFSKKPLSFLQTVTRTIKGIGELQAFNLIKLAGINPIQKLTSEGIDELSMENFEIIEKTAPNSLLLDRTLDRFDDENIQRKIKVGTYKGQMFLFGLPVRGQRTKTNAKTNKKGGLYKVAAAEVQQKKQTNKKSKKTKK